VLYVKLKRYYAMMEIQEYDLESSLNDSNSSTIVPFGGYACGVGCTNGMACGAGCGHGVGSVCGTGCSKG